MTTPLIPQDDFNEITRLIHAARQRAVQAVNTALIELYWQVGQFISRKIEQAEWGGIVRGSTLSGYAMKPLTQPTQALHGLPAPTCSGCGSFMRRIRSIKSLSTAETIAMDA